MSSRFVFIARHAWAGQFGDPQWPDDNLRELEEDGAERFMQVVEALADRGFAPEIIATSPLARCRQTAEIIAKHTMHHPEVVELEALVPGSNLDAVIEWTRKAAVHQVCWVGHAPDVGLMTAALVGDGTANIRFAKGAISAIRLFGEVSRGEGELYWHTTAKALGV